MPMSSASGGNVAPPPGAGFEALFALRVYRGSRAEDEADDDAREAEPDDAGA